MSNKLILSFSTLICKNLASTILYKINWMITFYTFKASTLVLPIILAKTFVLFVCLTRLEASCLRMTNINANFLPFVSANKKLLFANLSQIHRNVSVKDNFLKNAL